MVQLYVRGRNFDVLARRTNGAVETHRGGRRQHNNAGHKRGCQEINRKREDSEEGLKGLEGAKGKGHGTAQAERARSKPLPARMYRGPCRGRPTAFALAFAPRSLSIGLASRAEALISGCSDVRRSPHLRRSSRYRSPPHLAAPGLRLPLRPTPPDVDSGVSEGRHRRQTVRVEASRHQNRTRRCKQGAVLLGAPGATCPHVRAPRPWPRPSYNCQVLHTGLCRLRTPPFGRDTRASGALIERRRQPGDSRLEGDALGARGVGGARGAEVKLALLATVCPRTCAKGFVARTVAPPGQVPGGESGSPSPYMYLKQASSSKHTKVPIQAHPSSCLLACSLSPLEPGREAYEIKQAS